MNRSIDFGSSPSRMLTVLGLCGPRIRSRRRRVGRRDAIPHPTAVPVAGGLVLCGVTAFTPTGVIRRCRHFIYTVVMVDWS